MGHTRGEISLEMVRPKLNQALHGYDSVEQIVNTAGGRLLTGNDPEEMLKKGGEIILRLAPLDGRLAADSVTNHHGTWIVPTCSLWMAGIRIKPQELHRPS